LPTAGLLHNDKPAIILWPAQPALRKTNIVVPESEGQERRIIHYSGHVQGVGFRYTARRVAAGFRVAGYVQNLPDGRVKVVAEATAAELDRFLAAVRAALAENIDHEQTEIASPTGEFAGFDIRF
jgi:acylphosphatase